VRGTLSPPPLQMLCACPVVGWAPLESLFTTHLYALVRSGAGGGSAGKRASAYAGQPAASSSPTSPGSGGVPAFRLGFAMGSVGLRSAHGSWALGSSQLAGAQEAAAAMVPGSR